MCRCHLLDEIHNRRHAHRGLSDFTCPRYYKKGLKWVTIVLSVCVVLQCLVSLPMNRYVTLSQKKAMGEPLISRVKRVYYRGALQRKLGRQSLKGLTKEDSVYTKGKTPCLSFSKVLKGNSRLSLFLCA